MLTKLDLVIDTVGSYHDLLWYGIYHDVHWCFMMAPVLWQFFYTCHLQIVKPLGHYRCLVFWHFLTIGLRTRRFSEPTVCLLSSLTLSCLTFFLLALSLLTLRSDLAASLSRSKLPSNISSIALSATYVLDESCILTCCPSDSVLLLCYPNVILGSTKRSPLRSPTKSLRWAFWGTFRIPSSEPNPSSSLR